MGYHLNGLDEPVFMAVSKPLLTEFGIHLRLESCALISSLCYTISRLVPRQDIKRESRSLNSERRESETIGDKSYASRLF